MGMFDGIIGGMVGAEMVTVVNGFIARHGGVQGVIGQLQSNGFGPTVNSWMAPGQDNAPIAPSQVHQAFGEQTIGELAAKAGITPQELSEKLATVLPQIVTAHAATPQGQ